MEDLICLLATVHTLKTAFGGQFVNDNGETNNWFKTSFGGQFVNDNGGNKQLV